MVQLKNDVTKLKHDNETLSNQLYVMENMKPSTYVQPEFSLCSEQYFSQPSVQLKKD